MRRLLLFVLIAVAGFARAADETWIGLYLGEQKLGWSTSVTREDTRDGKAVRRTESSSVVQTVMLGEPMTLRSESVEWATPEGRLIRGEYVTESGGRIVRVTADFGPREIRATTTTAGAAPQSVTVPIPEGVEVGADPSAGLLDGDLPPVGTRRTVHTFDSTTLTLVKVELTLVGPTKIEADGRQLDVIEIRVDDPRAPLRYFVSAKGDFVEARGPFGLVMRPESREQALKMPVDPAPADLADTSAITPDRPIAQAETLKRLTLHVTGLDLGRIPSDAHQTVASDGDGWRWEVHPVGPDERTTISAAREARPDWVKSEPLVPSDDPEFVELAREVVGEETRVVPAAGLIREWVFRRIKVNAGIGVLRDASEVVATSEGVCRDHAVLMTTMLRAAGIPTRAVAGLVYADGRFYYHIWVEVWDGSNWFGLDSTRPQRRLSATHLKVSQGTVGEAMTGFILDGARFTVVEPAP